VDLAEDAMKPKFEAPKHGEDYYNLPDTHIRLTEAEEGIGHCDKLIADTKKDIENLEKLLEQGNDADAERVNRQRSRLEEHRRILEETKSLRAAFAHDIEELKRADREASESGFSERRPIAKA